MSDQQLKININRLISKRFVLDPNLVFGRAAKYMQILEIADFVCQVFESKYCAKSTFILVFVDCVIVNSGNRIMNAWFK